MQIWGAENEPVPAGPERVGEIVVRGVNVRHGYFDDPKATAETFTRGWLRSGDLGYSDGSALFVDRKKD